MFPLDFNLTWPLVRSYPSNVPWKLSVVCKLLKTIQFNLQHSCHLDFHAGLLKVRVSLLSSQSFGQHNPPKRCSLEVLESRFWWWIGRQKEVDVEAEICLLGHKQMPSLKAGYITHHEIMTTWCQLVASQDQCIFFNLLLPTTSLEFDWLDLVLN